MTDELESLEFPLLWRGDMRFGDEGLYMATGLGDPDAMTLRPVARLSFHGLTEDEMNDAIAQHLVSLQMMLGLMDDEEGPRRMVLDEEGARIVIDPSEA